MGIVWFVFGTIMGIGFWEVARRSLVYKVSSSNVFLMIAWLCWILFTGCFVLTSIYEGEPRAAGVGAMIFGAVAVVTSTMIRKPLAQLVGKEG